MSTPDKMLKSMMGDKGYETLKKTIYRKDSDSTLGVLDLYLPLMVLPRTILSWLVQNIKPMKPNDVKEFSFPGNADITIHVQKTGRDSYRAEFVEGGRIIHEFDKQTLPLVGGHLMTIGEIYNDEPEKDSYPEDTGEPKKTVESAMIEMANTPQISPDDSEKFKWAMAHENVKELTGVIGKLVDAFVSNHMFKENISKELDKEEVKETLEKPYVSEAQRKFFHTDTARRAGITEADTKHWDEASKGKKLPERAAKEEKKAGPGRLYTRSDFTAKVEPPGAAASPQQAHQPQGAAPAVSANKDPIAAQRKQGQLAFKQKFHKPILTPAKKPTSSYFKDKLNKPVTKSEYHVSEAELYSTCFHCDVAEFVKSEDGPKYAPCACFLITLKSDEGKKMSFVQVLRKKEGGFSLKFNEKADTEAVQAFLVTLRNRLR